MANYDIKKDLDTYFKNNWINTGIQYQDENEPRVGGVLTDPSTLNEFISLIYSPVENDSYGFDGTATGRIEYAGIQKVFCYAKNSTKALLLADQIKAFFNGKQIGDIVVGIGQDSSSNNLGNGFYEVLCYFNLSQWS